MPLPKPIDNGISSLTRLDVTIIKHLSKHDEDLYGTPVIHIP